MKPRVRYSVSDSDESDSENSYCIFLHIVEGVGLNAKESGDFDRHKQKIVLYASLNGVRFEVEGHCMETTTIFNSNVIWECELADVKRMKTDNRPVKLECFVVSNRGGNSPRKQIGTLLLPIRGVQILSHLRNVQIKLLWHKLTGLSSIWREIRPELHLLLIIVKKNFVDSGQFEAILHKYRGIDVDAANSQVSETSNMLQSQSNIYVQLLEQVGLIQVGNNPDVDCDIFTVSLTFKQIKGIDKHYETNTFAFSYDFLGNVSQFELNPSGGDCLPINEKISLSFKSSLQSLHIYFQRIFYIPISLYHNGIVLATHRLDFDKLLPDDLYFSLHKIWQKSSSFTFECAEAVKPTMEFIFNMQLVRSFAKKMNYTARDMAKTLGLDDKASGDIQTHLRQLSLVSGQMYTTNNDMPTSATMNCYNYNMEKYIRDQSALLALGAYQYEPDKELIVMQSRDEVIKVARSQSTHSQHSLPTARSQNIPLNVDIEKVSTGVNTEAELKLEEKQDTIETCRSSQENLLLNKCDSKTNENIDDNNSNKSVNSAKSLATCDSSKKDVDLTEQHTSGYQTMANHDELTLKVVQELEEWKLEQVCQFVKELERKKSEYWAAMQEEWQQEKAALQNKLFEKIAKCEELNSKLQNAYLKLSESATDEEQNHNGIMQSVKQDIETKYAHKFAELERKMQELQSDVEGKAKLFQAQNKELERENSNLKNEKFELNERVRQLEARLYDFTTTQSMTEEIKHVIEDLRTQQKRFSEVEESREYYKNQWVQSVQELNNLQLSVLEKQRKDYVTQKKQIKSVKAHSTLSLQEILNDECKNLESERHELKSLKEMLFATSDSDCEQPNN